MIALELSGVLVNVYRLSEGKERTLICSACRLPWCTYCHLGDFKLPPLNVEVGKAVPSVSSHEPVQTGSSTPPLELGVHLACGVFIGTVPVCLHFLG